LMTLSDGEDGVGTTLLVQLPLDEDYDD
jgi:hypothetical protein